MLTIQIKINIERNISNTLDCFRAISHTVSTRMLLIKGTVQGTDFQMIYRKILVLLYTVLILLKQYKHHIVKDILQYLGKMQDSNVLQWVYVL